MQEELMRSAARGSEDACRRLFELWFPKAYRVGKSVCGSRSLAEDAVQEALIRFWNVLRKRKRQVITEGYFMRIVANEARRILMRRKAAPEEYLENLPDAGGTLDEAESERERFIGLLKAVNELPAKLKETVKLYYYGGFTEAETAEMLGISLSSVKMRLLRGRRKLREMLVGEGYEATGGY